MSLPHVRASQLRVAAAAARVELRQRERRLDPTLTLRGGTEDDETLVGLNVTIPLPVRNRYTYEVTAASAERRKAQQEASDISRHAYARFQGAQERYQLSRQAWQDWQRTGGVSLQRQSDRPEFLKNRIMGGMGHLSNEQALEAVLQIAEQSRLCHVAALHLSRECNSPRLLKRLFADRAPHLLDRLTITSQHHATSLLRVSRETPPATAARRGEQMALFG